MAEREYTSLQQRWGGEIRKVGISDFIEPPTMDNVKSMKSVACSQSARHRKHALLCLMVYILVQFEPWVGKLYLEQNSFKIYIRQLLRLPWSQLPLHSMIPAANRNGPTDLASALGHSVEIEKTVSRQADSASRALRRRYLDCHSLTRGSPFNAKPPEPC